MHSISNRIKKFNEGRLPDKILYKYKLMTSNMFSFYRGTCHIFYEDLYAAKFKITSPLSWICGDLHLENFGSYKGNNRLVYFDLNDFDEAILAGPEPEVARFLTSIIIAAGQMKVSGISLHKTLHDVMDAYTSTLLKGKALMLEAAVAHGEFKKYFEHVATLDRQSFIAKRTLSHSKKLLAGPSFG